MKTKFFAVYICTAYTAHYILCFTHVHSYNTRVLDFNKLSFPVDEDDALCNLLSACQHQIPSHELRIVLEPAGKCVVAESLEILHNYHLKKWRLGYKNYVLIFSGKLTHMPRMWLLYRYLVSVLHHQHYHHHKNCVHFFVNHINM